jgi:hypothetical protein
MVCVEGAAWCSSVWGKSGSPVAHMYNNIMIVDGTVNPGVVSTLAHMERSGDFYFDNNLWWRVEGGVHFDWGGTAIDTWADWQALGFDANGMNADPQIVGALGGGPAAYKLTSSSPARDAARTVTEALRGMGTQDYFGVAIPQGGAYDIGFAEYEGGGPPPTDTPVPPTDTPEPTNTPGGPTDTPVPPTDTPPPPTDTPEPTPTNTPGAGDLPFFDGFEDGDLNGWTISSGSDVQVRDITPYEGVYNAGAKRGGTFERTISTAGSTNVHVKYAGMTTGFEAGESLKVEWYDGSTWHLLDELNSETWVYRDWDMPAGADDNAAFALRFTGNADKNTEWANADNIEVTGQ